MEHTYERQRRSKTYGYRKSGKGTALAPRECRRLVQLAVSAGLFLLVFLGRGVFPTQWRDMLGQNTDFAAAFTGFGEAVSRGEPVLDTLGNLWTEVFAGGVVEDVPNPMWESAPAFSQRLAEQLAEPGDPVGARSRLVEWTAAGPDRETEGSQPAAPKSREGSSPAGAEPVLQEKTVLLGGEPLVIQSAMPLQPVEEPEPEPVIETAVAQAFTEDGQALPASVSMLCYTLGLEETVAPVSAVLTSDYGYRSHPVSGDYRFHKGVDLGAPTGSEILAFSGGTVTFTGRSDVCGLYLQIDHGNGVSTFYAHCSEINVLDGQTVTAGQVVARVGETGNATGPHLHFALIKDGIYLDPMYYIEVG